MRLQYNPIEQLRYIDTRFTQLKNIKIQQFQCYEKYLYQSISMQQFNPSENPSEARFEECVAFSKFNFNLKENCSCSNTDSVLSFVESEEYEELDSKFVYNKYNLLDIDFKIE
ncbi:Hypothetical_protein [Hexamita inflata]|uniref:Hypothetical_protein n=1 Tax=Hexamita inflata TaxID=28002 RepID=A0AA86QKX4_9EUKA|nr:Hypothetical protein HINF_LOCUS43312 [Hexamita inflata]